MGASKAAAASSNSDKTLCVDDGDGLFLRAVLDGIPSTCTDTDTRTALVASRSPINNIEYSVVHNSAAALNARGIVVVFDVLLLPMHAG